MRRLHNQMADFILANYFGCNLRLLKFARLIKTYPLT